MAFCILPLFLVCLGVFEVCSASDTLQELMTLQAMLSHHEQLPTFGLFDERHPSIDDEIATMFIELENSLQRNSPADDAKEKKTEDAAKDELEPKVKYGGRDPTWVLEQLKRKLKQMECDRAGLVKFNSKKTAQLDKLIAKVANVTEPTKAIQERWKTTVFPTTLECLKTVEQKASDAAANDTATETDDAATAFLETSILLGNATTGNATAGGNSTNSTKDPDIKWPTEPGAWSRLHIYEKASKRAKKAFFASFKSTAKELAICGKCGMLIAQSWLLKLKIHLQERQLMTHEVLLERSRSWNQTRCDHCDDCPDGFTSATEKAEQAAEKAEAAKPKKEEIDFSES